MKKRVASALIAAVTISMACSVYAAPSISTFIPEAPVVVQGNLQQGEALVVQNVNTGAYQDKTVAAVVEKANDENTVMTVKEILTELKVDTKQETKTESGQKVNPTLYEKLTPFADLVVKSGEEVKYGSTETGTIKASVTFEVAKEMEKEDLLMMQIDPDNGKVYFITAEELDKESGTITADFPTLGPVALLTKVPIVVKNVSPENYESEKTAEVVTQFIDEKKDISFDDVLAAMGIEKDEENGQNLEVRISEDVTVNRDDYTSSMGFADLAIKQGQENYLYDMDGSLEAEANRGLDEVDWERMVLSAYPDFDVEAAKEDPALLESLEPFVLKDSFIMQINPVTGEEEYIYEPVIYFGNSMAGETEGETGAEDAEAAADEATDVTAEGTEGTETGTDGTEDDEDALMRGWNIEDEDRKDTGIPNLVIRAEFKSMGPFAIFMNKDAGK